MSSARRADSGKTGHYADPQSPIASTPQRRPKATDGRVKRRGRRPCSRLCCDSWEAVMEGEAVVIEGGAGTDGPPSLAQLAPPHSPAHEAVAAEEAPAPSSAVSPSTGSSASEDDYEYDMEEFNPYLFMKMLPEYSLVAPAVPRICLPPKDPRSPPVTLVLDLDETLVHCSVEPIVGADLTFSVDFNGVMYTVFVRKRPHLARFLEAIYTKFEVVIFTASQKVYADKLLNLLDPELKYFKHRLFRDSCLNVDGNFLKDLNVLGRDLATTVLVDNSPHAFGYQCDNGIPIESWFEDPADTELIKLAAFLQTIQSGPDIRPALRRKFNVRGLVDRAAPAHSY